MYYNIWGWRGPRYSAAALASSTLRRVRAPAQVIPLLLWPPTGRARSLNGALIRRPGLRSQGLLSPLSSRPTPGCWELVLLAAGVSSATLRPAAAGPRAVVGRR
eukprot:991638-Pyramimonas_sp.AAC.1